MELKNGTGETEGREKGKKGSLTTLVWLNTKYFSEIKFYLHGNFGECYFWYPIIIQTKKNKKMTKQFY